MKGKLFGIFQDAVIDSSLDGPFLTQVKIKISTRYFEMHMSSLFLFISNGFFFFQFL